MKSHAFAGGSKAQIRREQRACANRPDLSRDGPLSLIHAGRTQSKGRSGLVGCFLSLVPGPFATFLIVVLDRASR